MTYKWLCFCLNLLFAFVPLLPTSSQSAAPRSIVSFSEGSLVEIKGKLNAHLIVIRSGVLEASGDSAASVVEAVRAGATTDRRHSYVYSVIGRKLNKYIRKYKTLSAVEKPSQADFFIVFNLLGYRRILYSYYPYGEMFVITNRTDGPARVLWRTPKEATAEDATQKLIAALKLINGQR